MNNQDSGQTSGLSRRELLRMLSATPLFGVVGACAVPGQGPAPRQFRLTPKSTFTGDLGQVDWPLVIERPDLSRGLDTTRIAIIRGGGTELEYFANATWESRPAEMVQRLLVESFKNSGRIRAVGNERMGLRPKFTLKTDLREFQAEYDENGNPVVDIRFDAKLVQMPRRQLVDTTSSARRVSATSNKIEDIIVAFDEALGKVFKDLVAWTLQTGESALADA